MVSKDSNKMGSKDCKMAPKDVRHQVIIPTSGNHKTIPSCTIQRLVRYKCSTLVLEKNERRRISNMFQIMVA